MRKSIVGMSLLLVLNTGVALAQGAPSPTPSSAMKKGWNPTPTQRENMAKMHEQMAACLRSTKTMKECHDEMRKSCEALGKEGCPMMKWEHGKDMMRHKKMMHDESNGNP